MTTARYDSMSEREITLTRRYATSRRKVFDAWTRPAVLRRWAFVPTRKTTKSVRVDLFAGGRLELLQRGGLDESRRWGRFREVHPPHRLTFSWTSNELGLDGVSTQVSVQFKGGNDESTLTLVHEGLPTEATCEANRRAWEALLDSLEALLSAR